MLLRATGVQAAAVKCPDGVHQGYNLWLAGAHGLQRDMLISDFSHQDKVDCRTKAQHSDAALRAFIYRQELQQLLPSYDVTAVLSVVWVYFYC